MALCIFSQTVGITMIWRCRMNWLTSIMANNCQMNVDWILWINDKVSSIHRNFLKHLNLLQFYIYFVYILNFISLLIIKAKFECFLLQQLSALKFQRTLQFILQNIWIVDAIRQAAYAEDEQCRIFRHLLWIFSQKCVHL